MWHDYACSQQLMLDERKVLDFLPKKMKGDIAIHVHLDVLLKVTLFQDFEKTLLRELVLKLRPALFVPGDYICKKGEIGKEMYIVNHGIVQVMGGATSNQVLAELERGSVFGEISLLTVGGGNRRTAHVRSKGFSMLLLLSKKDLYETLVDYPDAQETLKRKARSLLRQDKKREHRQSQGSKMGVAANHGPSSIHSNRAAKAAMMALTSVAKAARERAAVGKLREEASISTSLSHDGTSQGTCQTTVSRAMQATDGILPVNVAGETVPSVENAIPQIKVTDDPVPLARAAESPGTQTRGEGGPGTQTRGGGGSGTQTRGGEGPGTQTRGGGGPGTQTRGGGGSGTQTRGGGGPGTQARCREGLGIQTRGGGGPGTQTRGGEGPGTQTRGGGGSGTQTRGGGGPGTQARCREGLGIQTRGGGGPGTQTRGGEGPGTQTRGGGGSGTQTRGGEGPGTQTRGGEGPGTQTRGGEGPGTQTRGGEGASFQPRERGDGQQGRGAAWPCMAPPRPLSPLITIGTLAIRPSERAHRSGQSSIVAEDTELTYRPLVPVPSRASSAGLPNQPSNEPASNA
eukprot:Em0023g770a